ncbi:TniQ family protein [Ralstonia pseudosolanacearum]|uniref:TniQ family protein n=1 Tax=Ralstonia pseudosolanacearum TaxID=1310165 RepID=UPI003AAE9C14
MTISSISRPPCRPKILPDEWVETYLLRLAKANGLRRPWKHDIELFRPTLPYTAQSDPNGHPSWGVIILPSWSVLSRGSRIRYCPACMAESKHIRERWRLASFEVCTIHNIRLKDDLIEPAFSLVLGQPNKHALTDVTDDQLWAGAVCPMPLERDYVNRMWAGFEQSILDRDVVLAVSNLPYTLLLERLLDTLAVARRGRAQPRSDAQRAMHRAAFASRYNFSTIATLDGVRIFLDQIKEPLHRRTALDCLRRILSDEELRPTSLSSVPIAELRDRLSLPASERNAAGAGPAQSLSNRADRARYVSLKRATFLIGCRPGLLHHLVHHQYFRGLKVLARGMRRERFLPLHEVEACRRWYHSVRTPGAAMRELQIDKRGYCVLVEANLLGSMKIESRTWHRRSDVNNLCRHLEDISQPYSAGNPSLRPLLGDWMFDTNTARSVLHDLLKDIFDGKFHVFRRLDASGISAYYVDHMVVDRLRLLRRNYREKRKSSKALPDQSQAVLE